MTLGRANEAIELFQQAVDLDPLNAANYAMLGEQNFDDGRISAAEHAWRMAVELAPPDGFGARGGLAQVLLVTGQLAAALTAFEQLESGDDREWGKALAYSALGRKADSDSALADLKTRFAGTDAYSIAQVHAYRGEIDEAFKWLDRAYQQHHHELSIIKTDWLMTKLRGDPRYNAFLRKMNLPE